MSPTSYRAAPPRNRVNVYYSTDLLLSRAGPRPHAAAMDNLDAELAFAVGAAEAAGAVLRGYFGQALAIEHKDRG